MAANTSLELNPNGGSQEQNDPPGSILSYAVTTLGSGAVSDGLGVRRDYEFKKLISPSGHKTYMHWIPMNNNTKGAVIIFLPYEGLNWSDDPLDLVWYNRGPGLANDDAGPFYDPATSSKINYNSLSVLDSVNSGLPYYTSGVSVLLVYGRFYSGANLLDHATDVATGLWFLNGHKNIPANLIGIQSGSWGGVGSLFGIQQSNVKPKVGAIFYPVSDSQKMKSYVQTEIRQLTSSTQVILNYDTFFDPYLRRIQHTVQLPLYSGVNEYQQNDLTKVPTNILFVHDEWDTLVPYQHTLSLMTQLNNPQNLMYHHNHQQPLNYTTFALNHTQSAESMPNEAVLMWAYIYQLTQILPSGDSKIIFYSSSVFINQFQHVVSLRGLKSTAHYKKILQLLCSSNLVMYDYTQAFPVASGLQLLNYMLNTYVSGWTSTETNACEKLETQSPF